MYDQYQGKGLAFVSVNVTWDKESDAKRFVEEYHLPYPVGRDGSGTIDGVYGVDATPVTLLIGRDGKVMFRREGEMTEAEFVQQIDKLLASS